MTGLHDHAAMGRRFSALVAAAPGRVTNDDVGLNHCLTLLGQGIKEWAARARAVLDTIAACTALGELAAANGSVRRGYVQSGR